MYEEAHISCPILVYNDVYDMLNQSLLSRKYIPDSKRLAKYCGYNAEEIGRLIEMIKKEGAGKHMHDEQVIKIERDAYRYSEEIRASWNFKRESITEDSDIESFDMMG